MARYEDLPCLDCGKIRKVQIRNGQPISLRCHPCGAKHRVVAKPDSWAKRENHPRWKGGIHSEPNGYRSIVVSLDSPYLSMADDRGRIYEHRLVVAQSIGRCLTSTEEVHHLNGDKTDNRLSNLLLLSKAQHNGEHRTEIKTLRAEVSRLREELRKASTT